MSDAAHWLIETGMSSSNAWHPENISSERLSTFAEPQDFQVGLIDNRPAVAAILQTHPTGQDWSLVDKDTRPAALYIHFLAVAREFAGSGLSKAMIDFAAEHARQNKCGRLRLDTDATTTKLMELYLDLDFELITIIHEAGGQTALYEKLI